MKNNNTILWIVGIIILVMLISNYQKSKEGMIGLNIHYYREGVEVFPKGLFSIVTPPGESFDQIAFDIYGSNTGNADISNIQIEDAYPQAFKNALPIDGIQNVKFRTTDLSYSPGSSVAITDTCGSILTGLGYSWEQEFTGSTCTYQTQCEPFFSVPCSFADDCKACITYFYGTSKIQFLYVCSDKVGKFMTYFINNPSSIDTSPEIINLNYEVPCGDSGQSLDAGETKLLWTSGLIDTEQFEGQTINFWIEVSGYDTINKVTIYPDRAYSGDITFEVEGRPSSTQSFFSTLFSVIDIGGQTYHHDSAVINLKGGAAGTLVDYSGSGYLTGIKVAAPGASDGLNLIIDGTSISIPFTQADRFYRYQYRVDYHNIIRFDTSLKVVARGGFSTEVNVYYSISYMTD